MILTRPNYISEERPAEIEVEYNKYDEFISSAKSAVMNNVIANGKHKYVSIPITYDTETTTVKLSFLKEIAPEDDMYVGFPYLHQFYFMGHVVLIRDEVAVIRFFDTLEEIASNAGVQFIIYVHNFSFEFSFLKSRISFNTEHIMAVSKRSILRAETKLGGIQFRCSYKLSNMSLEKFTENYCSPEYRKDKELIDYEVVRYPWSELTNDVLYYSAMDVITLAHAIFTMLQEDDLFSIPLTSTGFVRRDMENSVMGSRQTRRDKFSKDHNKYIKYKKYFQKQQLTLEQYKLCEQVFRGGDTHANSLHIGEILENVGSYDFASSYPAIIICSNEFPVDRLLDCKDNVKSLDDMKRYSEKYWLIVEFAVENLELRKKYGTADPYLSKSKVALDFRQKSQVTDENGRIVQAPGISIIRCLGCELSTIMKQYKFTNNAVKVLKAYCATKGYLPLDFRKECFHWYRLKTELKGVEGMEYEYMKSKNKVNSVFGMMVEKIVKPKYEYCSDTNTFAEIKATKEESERQLKEYYSFRSNKFLQYQWGITVTALARIRLQGMINIVDYNDLVYWDTDSCKMLNPEKYEKAFQEYNDRWINSISNCGCKYSARTKKGELQILGIADREKDYERFCTLGAKKYAYEQKNKYGKTELHITVAGVPKTSGAKLLGSLENFKPGFSFYVEDSAPLDMRQSAKKMLTYHDETDFLVEIDGHTLHVGSGIGISRTSYTLSITEELQDYVSWIQAAKNGYVQDSMY